MELNELLDNSRLVKPYTTIKDKNNCLGSWRKELQKAYDNLPIKKEDPFDCDCESCVRKQKEIVNTIV